MKISVCQRHYIKDDETLEGLRGIVERTINVNKKKPDISQNLIVQYPANLDVKIKEKISEEQKKLIDKDITVLSTLGYGAGFAWYNSMFNFLGEKSAYRNQVNEHPKGFMKTMIDGDQYSIDDSNVLDGIVELGKRLTKNNELFGISARDSVSLASTPELDNARKVEEMFHAKTMNNIKVSNPLNIKIKDVPKSYLKYGDPVPGLYMANTDHREFINFLNKCSTACINANLNGYAGDPYASMKASTLTKTIPSIYIPTRGNPAGPFNIDNIKNKSIELGKTDISENYFETVSGKPFKRELSGEYGEELVNNVSDMILVGLSKGTPSKT